MKIPVVFAFDDGYALPASVAIRSLVESKRPETEYEIIVMHGGLCKGTVRKMDSIAPIRWVRVDSSHFSGWPKGWDCPMCHRLVMADVLKNCGKVIWSDCDVIFNCDLTDLYATDIEGWDWAAIPMERADETEGIHRHWNRCDTVFASGCLVMDLEHWRRERFVRRFADTAIRYDKALAMPDLDVLNSIGAKIKPLSLRYCSLVRLITQGAAAPEYRWLERTFGTDALDEAIKSPEIIHYAGLAMKVWLMRLGEMPPVYRSAIVRSPFWDPDRVHGGWRMTVKALGNAFAYALTGKARFRRQAGVYRRGA